MAQDPIRLEGIARRELLKGAGLLLGALALAPHARADEKKPFEIPADVRGQLESASLVHVSPLRSNGAESSCHAEIWYFMDGNDIVVGTDPRRWKGQAVQKGLDRARIWLPKSGGDFRAGYTFVARASVDKDPTTFDRLLVRFGQKYPAEWAKWEPRFKKGYADGTRVLIRYRPIAG
jgi:hypothetical protein